VNWLLPKLDWPSGTTGSSRTPRWFVD